MNEENHNSTLLSVTVDSTEAERVTAVYLATMYSLQVVPGWQRRLFSLISCGLIYIIFILALWGGEERFLERPHSQAVVGLLVVSLVGWLLVRHAWQRVFFRQLAQQNAAHYSVSLQEDHLLIIGERQKSVNQWAAVTKIERHAKALVCYLYANQVLYLPYRCFADQQHIDTFTEALVKASGVMPLDRRAKATQTIPAIGPLSRSETEVADKAVDSGEASIPAPQPASSWRSRLWHFVSGLFSNLYAGALFMFFQRRAPSYLRVSNLQLVGLIFLEPLITLGFEVKSVGLSGEFYWSALPYQFWELPWLLLGALIATRLAPIKGRLVTAMLAIVSINLLFNVLTDMIAYLPASIWRTQRNAWQLLQWLTFAWCCLAIGVALIRLCGIVAPGRQKAVLLLAALVLLPAFYWDSHLPELWTPRYDESKSRSRWDQVTQEAVLYAQPRLLDEALAKVAPSQPGRPNLYLVALAGYGRQDVFLREVTSVETLFAERFDTQNRSVVLVNNPATVLERPIASVTALERTLETIGERMNRDEDVLFLFMTSHGSANFLFSLELWPYRFDDLTPRRLIEMLDASGIQNRVIVISACYSGGFVPVLADDHTLVMSASSEERNSHGCSHEAEWTFFGRAYFDEALRQTTSFEDAFYLAKEKIAEREKAEGLTASEPQISVGKSITATLRALDAQQHGRTEKESSTVIRDAPATRP